MTNNKTNLLWLTTLAMTFMSGCSSQPDFVGSPLVKSSQPATELFNTNKLSNLENTLENLDTTSVVVLKDGEVVYQYGDTSVVSYLASCRKSILSMLYGPHVADGTINLSTTLGDMGIDDVDGLLPIEKQATIRDIMSARSGVFHRPANGGYDEANVLPRGSVKPGEYYLYNNWDFNVAGHIFEQQTGQNIYQAMTTQLAKPLGFQDWRLDAQKKYHKDGRSQYPAYHMYLSTRDMAKLGQLMLDKGQWNGEQLIPSSWYDWSVSPITSVDEVNARYGQQGPNGVPMAYGSYWWLLQDDPDKDYDAGAFSATGWGGQFITVLPEVNMVVAHKAKLGTLTMWGLTSGGVSNPTYWKLVDELMQARVRS